MEILGILKESQEVLGIFGIFYESYLEILAELFQSRFT